MAGMTLSEGSIAVGVIHGTATNMTDDVWLPQKVMAQCKSYVGAPSACV